MSGSQKGSMAMGSPVATTVVSPAEMIVNDFNGVSKSAGDLATRLQNLKDTIFGPVPTDGKADPPVVAVGLFQRLEAVRQSTDVSLGRAHLIMNDLEEGLGGKNGATR